MDQRDAVPWEAPSSSQRSGRRRLAVEESLGRQPAEKPRLAVACQEQVCLGLGISRLEERRGGEVCMDIMVGGWSEEEWLAR